MLMSPRSRPTTPTQRHAAEQRLDGGLPEEELQDRLDRIEDLQATDEDHLSAGERLELLMLQESVDRGTIAIADPVDDDAFEADDVLLDHHWQEVN